MAGSHFLEVRVKYAGMGSVENASTATALVVSDPRQSTSRTLKLAPLQAPGPQFS